MSKIGRNDPCPCGSGIKYKKCCIGKIVESTSDPLDAKMQKGYSLLEKDKLEEACNIWLTVWEGLKERITPEIRSIENTDKVFSGLQSIYNWSSDLAMELYNAGLKNRSYFEKLIKYSKEFYTLLPDSPDIFLQNMKTAEAESYFALGKVEQGEKVFKELTTEYPEAVWPLINWGDMYAKPFSDSNAKDLEKAVSLYRQAMEIATDEYDKEGIQQRLDEIV